MSIPQTGSHVDRIMICLASNLRNGIIILGVVHVCIDNEVIDSVNLLTLADRLLKAPMQTSQINFYRLSIMPKNLCYEYKQQI